MIVILSAMLFAMTPAASLLAQAAAPAAAEGAAEAPAMTPVPLLPNPGEVNTPESADMKPRRAIVLSMQEAVRLTLENSMRVKINRVSPEVALAAIQKAEAKFDWSFVSTWAAGRSEVLSTDSTETNRIKNESESQSIKAGLKKQLMTGGTIAPTLKWQRDQASGAQQTTDLFVTITHPLLRNAGRDVNLADVYLARNNADVSRNQFKDAVLTTLATMQGTYWDLVFAIEDLDVKRKSLRLTRDTLDQTRAQVEAGLLAPIEVARVRADLAAKETDILTAQQTLEEKEDLLRQFINKRGNKLLEDIGVIPLERAAYVAVDLDLESEAIAALASRPDYQVFRLAVQARDIELVVAKNQKLPVVDLAATFSLNGLGANTGQSVRTMSELDYHDWQASVSVEVPIGNRAAKAGYTTARLNKIKAVLELKNAEDDIIIAVKRDVRQVSTSLKRISSTRVARELAEERLRAEQERFNVGTALILDVLNAQTLLAEAESAERRSIVDYNKALISLERSKGTLLERDHIFLSGELGPEMK